MYFNHHEKNNLTKEDKKIITLLYMMKKRGTLFSLLPKAVINEIFSLTKEWHIESKHDLTYLYKAGQCFEISGKQPWKVKPIFLPLSKSILKIIPAQSDSTFYLDNDHNYYASGNNAHGELGLGSATPKYVNDPVPLRLPNNKKIKHISPGYQFTFIEDCDGDWYGCGSNRLNKLQNTFFLGIAKYENLIDITLPNKNKIKKIVAGKDHVFMCDVQGTWYGYGSNDLGQLGIPNQNLVERPTEIKLPNNNPIKKIKTFSNITLMQDINGNWYGCGYNYLNLLGLFESEKFPAIIDTPTLIKLPSGKSIKNIIPSNDARTFIQDIENNWYGVGLNEYNLAGVMTSPLIYTPMLIQLPNSIGIKKILGDYSHTFALGEDNQWYGISHFDVLGLGHKNSDSPFTLLDFSSLDNKLEESLKMTFSK